MDFTRRVECEKYIKLTDKDGYVTTIVKEDIVEIVDNLIDYIDQILQEKTK